MTQISSRLELRLRGRFLKKIELTRSSKFERSPTQAGSFWQVAKKAPITERPSLHTGQTALEVRATPQLNLLKEPASAAV
jgi:hypothetical protein